MKRVDNTTRMLTRTASTSANDLAIVGVAGTYPDATSPEERWENLRVGKDSIVEVPIERWDHARYFDPDKHRPGKTYCKWGGFIRTADEFDSSFFEIPPR